MGAAKPTTLYTGPIRDGHPMIHHLVDQRLAVGHRRLLIGRRTTEIAPRPHARADAANRQTRLVRGGLHLRRINMLRSNPHFLIR
jgi:hypothetical protein